MSDQSSTFSAHLTHRGGYQFDVAFNEVEPTLHVDEMPPLGEGAGPNPARLLASAVGHCLSASFLYCVGRQRIAVSSMETAVEGTMVRNENGRLRIGELRVKLAPLFESAEQARIARCLDLFEDFCVVTQSVRQGISVSVDIEVGTQGAEVGSTDRDSSSPR